MRPTAIFVFIIGNSCKHSPIGRRQQQIRSEGNVTHNPSFTCSALIGEEENARSVQRSALLLAIALFAGGAQLGSAACTPLETRAPNAPEQRPAFAGQTRICSVTSNV